MKIPEKGKKAQLILFYNKTKGGVDTVDTQDFWNDAFWTHKTKVEIFWVMHSTTQIKQHISTNICLELSEWWRYRTNPCKLQ